MIMTTETRSLPLEGATRPLPLEGIRIADVTVVWAGPHVTQLLAEWGAEVIRVEPRTSVQPLTRGAELVPQPRATLEMMMQLGMTLFGYPDLEPGDEYWERSPSFTSHARNKLSMTADIMTDEGREAFFRLIEKCDVIVENNVPETIEKAGITYEQLRERNPNLIMLRMPAFGLDGPYKNYRALGTHIEGMIGHHYLRGYTDADPEAAGDVYTGDAIAGVMGAFAVTMALRHRARTGEGQQIELSQAENFLPMLGDFILDYTVNQRDSEPQGNRHRSHAPHNVYPCTGDDEWIAIDCDSEDAWRAICEVLGAPALLEDERFTDMPLRHQNQRVLDRELAEYTRPREVMGLFLELQAAGVIAGPLQNEARAVACPQLLSRGFFEELSSEAIGTHNYPGLNFRMRGTPNHLRTPSPTLGQHNQYVYKDVIGYTDDEYAAAEATGQIGAGYDPAILPPRPE
jgi:crotonobetainyl-CoA:carnitine CoA-transferase CaiB-like acyl-CoA transferase